MSEPVALEDIKTHLRLDPDATDEDVYLTSLIIAARRMVERETQRTIVGPAPTIVDDDLEVAKHAIRLIVGNWYANREPVVDAKIMKLPHSLQWIFDGLLAWYDGDDD